MIRNMAHQRSRVGPSPEPMKTVYSKRGSVLGPAGSRAIKMEVEKLRLLAPSQIRKLLEDNKSLAEIKAIIEEDENPSFIYRGEIWLDGMGYKLIGIDLACKEDETVLKAELAEFREGIWSCTIGNIVGHIETRENTKSAEGKLVIDDGLFCGSYTVLLDSLPKEDLAR